MDPVSGGIMRLGVVLTQQGLSLCQSVDIFVCQSSPRILHLLWYTTSGLMKCSIGSPTGKMGVSTLKRRVGFAVVGSQVGEGTRQNGHGVRIVTMRLSVPTTKVVEGRTDRKERKNPSASACTTLCWVISSLNLWYCSLVGKTP